MTRYCPECHARGTHAMGCPENDEREHDAGCDDKCDGDNCEECWCHGGHDADDEGRDPRDDGIDDPANDYVYETPGSKREV